MSTRDRARSGRRTTRRASHAAVGLAAAAVALSACTPVVLTPAPAKRSATKALHVDVVGDSLIRQAAPYIERRLNAAGFPNTIASELRAGLRSPFVQGQLTQIRSIPGDIVVISTANNDAIVQADMAAAIGQDRAQWDYRNALGDTAHHFGDRCVVIVNAKEDIAGIYNPPQAAILNSNMRDENTRRANMVITDWAMWSHFVPADQFMGDMFHFGPDPSSSVGTTASADAFAGTIEGGVKQCAALLRP